MLFQIHFQYIYSHSSSFIALDASARIFVCLMYFRQIDNLDKKNGERKIEETIFELTRKCVKVNLR